MKIVVCLKEVADVRLSLDFGLRNKVVLREGLPLRLNPNDASALARALHLKSLVKDVLPEITLISIGPERVESYLRQGLAMGADRAVRIREGDSTDLSPYKKAKILSKAISLLDPDLVLMGASSLDNASGQVGPLVAAWLGLPCICQVVGFQIGSDKENITVTRNISRGVRERVLSTLPVVLAVEGQNKALPYSALDEIIKSQEAAITRLSLADLGLSPSESKNDPTTVAGISFPRPRVKKVSTPDSSLPAFDRILALLQGGITRKRGEILHGSTTELVDQLYELLIKEHVISIAPGGENTNS